MAPGLTSAGGKMDDVPEGTTVGIFAEGTRRPVQRRAEAGGPRWPLRSGGGRRPLCGLSNSHAAWGCVAAAGRGWPRLCAACGMSWRREQPSGAPAGPRAERACFPRRQGARAGHRGHLGEHGADPSREQRQRRREHALAQRRVVGHAHRRHVGVAARVTRTLVRPRDADGPRPTQYWSSAFLSGFSPSLHVSPAQRACVARTAAPPQCGAPE